MKHCLLLSIGILTLLCGCTSEEEKIKKAAYEYSFALANYKVEDAHPYATEETRTTKLKRAETLVKMVDSNYIKSDSPATVEITEIHHPNDTMAVAHYHKTTPLKDMSGAIELRKRNGKWLVHEPLN